jgi:light-independent protochlorophyllide reductase subunit B
VYTTATLGMEKHLIDLFGDAGLEYEEASNLAQATGDTRHETADAPIEPTSLALPGLVSPAWAPEAQAMLKKVPFFVRGRVQKNVERYAAEQGQLLITAEVLQSAKEALGG